MRNRFKLMLVLALPYAFTVLLPIISLFCLGSMVTANYHEKIITDKQKNMESAFERFYQRIKNVETLSYMLAENSAIKQYAYESLRDVEHSVVDSMEMGNLLGDFLTNSDVETIYLYDPGDDRIITPDSSYRNAADYFRFYYRLEGYTPAQCVERLKASSWGYEFSSGVEAELNNKITEVIEYRLSIPLIRVTKEQPQLVLVMEVEEILGDLFDILEEGNELYLYDGKGKLIYSNGDRYENLLDAEYVSDLKMVQKEGEKVYGMVCHSSDQSWKIKVYIPRLMQGTDSDATTRYAWLLMGVSLIASIVLCVYFTFRNHREIQEILGMFRGQDETSDEEADIQNGIGYQIIKQYADKLIKENHRMKESIPRLENAQKYEILDKLLRNTYENQEEIARTFHSEEGEFFAGKCVVLCIRYKGSSYRTFVYEDITVKDFIKGLLGEIIERKFEIFDTSSRETICVLSMDDKDYEVIAEDIISRLNVEITYNYKIEVEIGVGNVVDSIYQIGESYQQAKAVLRYRETSGKNVHLYSELVKLDDVYYYPKEYDEKIYNYVVIGKKEEAKEIIQKIYRENFEENDRILTASAVEAIEGRLRDCLILLAGKYNISMEDKLSVLSNNQSVISFFKQVYETIDLIAENIVNKKKDVQQYTALKIMQYINENYCDNMLSLKQISQALGLHESYISNLFRNEYGEPVSGVIESRRIEKACKLIRNTDMKISDIAEAVGYSSDVSFRRAFKRIVGMSPGEYRR